LNGHSKSVPVPAPSNWWLKWAWFIVRSNSPFSCPR
jgi:hypothetical protein